MATKNDKGEAGAAQDPRLPYEYTAGRPKLEQLSEWKAKHGELNIVKIDDKVAVIRTPKLPDIEMAQAASKKPNAKPYDFNRNILGTCTLYIDGDFRSDDGREMALFLKVGDFVTIKEAEVSVF